MKLKNNNMHCLRLLKLSVSNDSIFLISVKELNKLNNN